MDASIEVYTEAVTRNPNDAIALISLGMALLRQERIPEALEHLSHAVEVGSCWSLRCASPSMHRVHKPPQ